jgi:DNA invertase Pin-like site-specific DNA recombinase
VQAPRPGAPSPGTAADLNGEAVVEATNGFHALTVDRGALAARRSGPAIVRAGRAGELARQARAVRVLGYASLPSAADDSGGPNGDLRSQSEKIAAACVHRGLSLLEVVHEREPRRGKALARPGLGYALELISAGEAEGLVVADLSRLTHSIPELGRVLEWFYRSNARLIAATPELDTGEQGGRIVVRALIELSQSERQRLVERTRKGMRAARRKGPRAVADDPELRDRIASMRADGMTLQAIADRLNTGGVPTVRGGAKWRPSSVQAAAGYRRRAAPEPFEAAIACSVGRQDDPTTKDYLIVRHRPITKEASRVSTA